MPKWEELMHNDAYIGKAEKDIEVRAFVEIERR